MGAASTCQMLSALCVYMPAIDRSLSACIYMPAIDRSLSACRSVIVCLGGTACSAALTRTSPSVLKQRFFAGKRRDSSLEK